MWPENNKPIFPIHWKMLFRLRLLGLLLYAFQVYGETKSVTVSLGSHAYQTFKTIQAGENHILNINKASTAPNIARSQIMAQDTQDQVIWNPSQITTPAATHTFTMTGAKLNEPLWVEIEGAFLKASGGAGSAGIPMSDFRVTVPNMTNVSAYSTQEGCFAGYAQNCTPGRTFAFETGKEFLQGLTTKTTEYGQLGDLYIFSHAWNYQSVFGNAHNGGFYGGGPAESGFYGTASVLDHADARTLAHLQTAINNGTIKFAPGKKIFLEGCHIGEIGTFVAGLAQITGRVVISACGGSDEMTDANGKIYFRSAPRVWEELQDPDYDGWLSGDAQIGANLYVW